MSDFMKLSDIELEQIIVRKYFDNKNCESLRIWKVVRSGLSNYSIQVLNEDNSRYGYMDILHERDFIKWQQKPYYKVEIYNSLSEVKLKYSGYFI